MELKKAFITLGLGLVVIATAGVAVMSRQIDPEDAKSKDSTVAYHRIGMDTYQNFLGNWDNGKHPVLYALIQTPHQYGALFHPAAVMGGNRAFGPEASLYSKAQILVVGRVIEAPENYNKVLEVERISESDGELVVRYRFNKPKHDATYRVKNWLALQIPKRDYKKVTFYENGKEVGELRTAEGQWSIPAVTPKTKS